MPNRQRPNLQIVPLTPVLGAEVFGVDLSGGIDAETFGTIHQALLEHLVLVFKDQQMTPQAQVEFTRRFGPVEPHPLKARAGHPEIPELLVLENQSGKRGARNDFWHSDISCAERPPAISFLHAKIIPEGRGDTMFCNMSAAWEGLSDGMRRMLDGMTAAHSGAAILARNLAADTDGNIDMDVPPPNTHPVVRRHPETGRPALFVNNFFTTNFTGMTAAESRPLLDLIEHRATAPENVYRHRWQAGDAVMWDNRCTMHYAVYDYDESTPRRMHRTTVAGDRPAA